MSFRQDCYLLYFRTKNCITAPAAGEPCLIFITGRIYGPILTQRIQLRQMPDTLRDSDSIVDFLLVDLCEQDRTMRPV